MDHATVAAATVAASQGVTQLKHTLNLLNNHANLAKQLRTLKSTKENLKLTENERNNQLNNKYVRGISHFIYCIIKLNIYLNV